MSVLETIAIHRIFGNSQNIWSSGKSITAIVIAQLVEKGLLSYDERIVNYWPELEGKDDITLADVLRHEAGLAWLHHSFKKEDLFRESIKANKIGQVIEKEPLHFPTNLTNKREYHAFTGGCILNEIVRRVDPEGRTIGEIIKLV